MFERDVGVVLIKDVGEVSRWKPVTLPIWGHYNGYGSLERIENDPNVEIIAKRLAAGVRYGLVEISWTALRETPRQIATIEDVLFVVARSAASPRCGVLCEGKEISYAFVSTEIARAVCEETRLVNELSRGASGLARGEEPALTLYADLDPDSERWISAKSVEFAAIDALVALRGGWALPPLRQFSAEEELELIHDAMAQFAHLEAVMAVLRKMEEQVQV